jgi:hypothetical protein
MVYNNKNPDMYQIRKKTSNVTDRNNMWRKNQ